MDITGLYRSGATARLQLHGLPRSWKSQASSEAAAEFRIQWQNIIPALMSTPSQSAIYVVGVTSNVG